MVIVFGVRVRVKNKVRVWVRVRVRVFEHLKQLWMGIWQHIYAIIITELSPDLGVLAEILDDVSVEMISLHYHLGCRTFQTASHIHVTHI